MIIFQPFNGKVNYKQSSRNLNLRQVKQFDFEEKKYKYSLFIEKLALINLATQYG